MKLSKKIKRARLPMTVRVFLIFASYFMLLANPNNDSTMWCLLLLLASAISIFEGVS